ncbi:hydantoinase/oxoprolinase family protein [Acinetobacter pragensis]|uniref:5-oxoprolinase n=1 Tax=Acinetobacter pragensis TaxID=1806892 RepID=A0A151Y3Z4_9GAMM|nr:hydantoinase/oxoprolinase family protein [Acinetobacter pragensis]KYQ72736.1 hypothetical protein AZH43_07715 [Acinetobacter pragensis]
MSENILRPFRICVDTGGTFTDCVVLEEGKSISEFKSPSTPPDFSIGVLNALSEAAQGYGLTLNELLEKTSLLVHGTTAATNALTTRNVGRTAMLTTEGFRDIIEMRRSLKIETHSMYDAYLPPYEPLVPRKLRFPISETVTAQGDVLNEISEADLAKFVEVVKQQDIQAIAICFVNSYANGHNEKTAATYLRQHLNDDVFISTSSELLPKLGEYERFSTTVLSAALGPAVREYMSNLERSLGNIGFNGRLLIMQANQYANTVAAVRTRPAYLLGSGPAAAPGGASFLGDVIGEKNLIAVDMGGTTLDAAVVTDGTVPLASGQWLGDHRSGLKVVDVVSVGSGGGSIAWIDSLGMLKVGPQSAGALPGPACFGKGGILPTVTDAAVVLGYINPEYFWGGKMRLDTEAARQAICPLAEQLNISIEETAQGMLAVVNADMADGTAEVTTRAGHDVRNYALLAIGGGGALCGASIAENLGMDRVIVPRFSASFCAWSMLTLDVGRDYLRSYPIDLSKADIQHLTGLLDSMKAEARIELKDLTQDGAKIEFSATMDLHYQGQYHELELPFPCENITQADIAALNDAFHIAHERDFTFGLPNVPIILMNIRLIAKLSKPTLTLPKLQRDVQAIPQPNIKDAYFGSAWHPTQFHNGEHLPINARIEGPAVVQEATSTLVVPPGFTCVLDEYGNYLLNKGTEI